MKTQFTRIATASIISVMFGFSVVVLAEENEQHKHYKATMPEKSHQEYVDKNAENGKQDVSTDESKKKHHKHYKATMPGESHQAHTDQSKDKKKEEKTSEDSEPAKTHKHQKASMNGEKHNR
tara:strand:- start:87 stop:452 length:366 start_codon:yes stop_codon:yes gene_type:complete